MAKRKDVGTSHHTPIKHAIMREFIGKEVRAANSLGWYQRLVWIDLTAGNAIPAYSAPWHEACSPSILASHATQSRKPVIIDLYEKNPDTYARLTGSLGTHLPSLGYQRADENGWTQWVAGSARIRAWHRDGREAGIGHILRNDAVLVLNDPNSITEWAMRRRFTADLGVQARGIRTLSCIGFNVVGIKRTPFLHDDPSPRDDTISARSDWYDLIRSITDSLPDRLDLMLAGFTRDSSQWTYLFSSPKAWRDKGEEESVIEKAFTETGEPHDYELAWFKRDRAKFDKLVDRRILTQAELRDRENPTLPFVFPAQRERAGMRSHTTPTAST